MRPAGAGRAMVSAVLYRKPRPGGGGRQAVGSALPAGVP